jgi:hypothetical protein
MLTHPRSDALFAQDSQDFFLFSFETREAAQWVEMLVNIQLVSAEAEMNPGPAALSWTRRCILNERFRSGT